ncbi:uncharacterized protein LOC131044939 isoform X2 [Cryptomeria japonica]|uniref:uncharacterized protein LOC131044939 isoform X2 n=1 Tax=Cryptomeria japonica TaxID=3369 RepID=UPI0027DA8942|nr:uncharacterized protein LOC131044939 isoform X2 [Cryptomeria japonica]
MGEAFQFRSYNPQTGFLVADRSPYTLVFNSQSNSWYEGRPLVLSTDVSVFSRVGTPLCFNGIIFIVVRGKYIDAHELNEPIETLFRDDEDFFYRIIGYDVNEDQWSFSIFIPASVGFLYCITEWEGNLLVCASNSTYDRSNQRIRYSLDEGDGHFVFWKLSTKHKLWTEECELDLSNIFHAFWKVSASSGVV